MPNGTYRRCASHALQASSPKAPARWRHAAVCWPQHRVVRMRAHALPSIWVRFPRQAGCSWRPGSVRYAAEGRLPLSAGGRRSTQGRERRRPCQTRLGEAAPQSCWARRHQLFVRQFRVVQRSWVTGKGGKRIARGPFDNAEWQQRHSETGIGLGQRYTPKAGLAVRLATLDACCSTVGKVTAAGTAPVAAAGAVAGGTARLALVDATVAGWRGLGAKNWRLRCFAFSASWTCCSLFCSAKHFCFPRC